MSIISINGKISSGKDTVGKIIQYLTSESGDANSSRHRSYAEFLSKGGGSSLRNFDQHYVSDWEIKKFAGKLKLIGSILSGVPVEYFEDQEFKKQYMPEEWNSFVSVDFPEMTGEEIKNSDSILVETTYKRMTYREFLQKLGTEAMRDGLHTNVWVNALFADYKPTQMVSSFPPPATEEEYIAQQGYPSWCITDMRFPNEMEAVVERKGITIRVVRYPKTVEVSRGPKNVETIPFDSTNQKHMDLWKGETSRLHASETALDDAKFDYEILNDGEIVDLIEKVKEILIKENII